MAGAAGNYKGITNPRSKKLTSKQRGMAKIGSTITPYEKKRSQVSLNITVEKRNIDGKDTTIFRLTKSDLWDLAPGQKAPLPKEYTDEAAFGTCVATEVAAAAKAI